MRGMAASEALRAREGHPKRGSNALKLGLRIVVSAALLVFLVTKIPSGSVEPKDTHAGTLTFLALALALTFAGFVLSAWRWQRVLAVFDVHLPLKTLLGYYLAGQFVGNVLPSTIGGDVLRISRASKSTGGDIAFASVAIERLTGFVALPLLTLLGIAIKPSLLDVPHAWIAILISLVTVAALLVIVVRRRQPAPGRSLRQARELDALRRRGAHRGRPDAPRAGPRHERAHRRRRLPSVGRRGGVVRGARARRVRSRRVGARLRPRGGDGAGAPDLALGARHPRGSARAAAAPARRAHRQGDRRRPPLVRHDAHREPPRRAAVRGGRP